MFSKSETVVKNKNLKILYVLFSFIFFALMILFSSLNVKAHDLYAYNEGADNYYYESPFNEKFWPNSYLEFECDDFESCEGKMYGLSEYSSFVLMLNDYMEGYNEFILSGGKKLIIVANGNTVNFNKPITVEDGSTLELSLGYYGSDFDYWDNYFNSIVVEGTFILNRGRMILDENSAIIGVGDSAMVHIYGGQVVGNITEYGSNVQTYDGNFNVYATIDFGPCYESGCQLQIGGDQYVPEGEPRIDQAGENTSPIIAPQEFYYLNGSIYFNVDYDNLAGGESADSNIYYGLEMDTLDPSTEYSGGYSYAFTRFRKYFDPIEDTDSSDDNLGCLYFNSEVASGEEISIGHHEIFCPRINVPTIFNNGAVIHLMDGGKIGNLYDDIENFSIINTAGGVLIIESSLDIVGYIYNETGSELQIARSIDANLGYDIYADSYDIINKGSMSISGGTINATISNLGTLDIGGNSYVEIVGNKSNVESNVDYTIYNTGSLTVGRTDSSNRVKIRNEYGEPIYNEGTFNWNKSELYMPSDEMYTLDENNVNIQADYKIYYDYPMIDGIEKYRVYVNSKDNYDPTLNSIDSSIASSLECTLYNGKYYCSSGNKITITLTFSEIIKKYDTVSIVTNMGTFTQTNSVTLGTKTRVLTFDLTVDLSQSVTAFEIKQIKGNFYDLEDNKLELDKNSSIHSNSSIVSAEITSIEITANCNNYCVARDAGKGEITVTVTLNHEVKIDSDNLILTNIDGIKLKAYSSTIARDTHSYYYVIESGYEVTVNSYDFSATSYARMLFEGNPLESPIKSEDVSIDSINPEVTGIESSALEIYGGQFVYDGSEVKFKVNISEGVYFKNGSGIVIEGLEDVQFSFDDSSYTSVLDIYTQSKTLWIKAIVSTTEDVVSVTINDSSSIAVLKDKAGNLNSEGKDITVKVLRIDSAVVTSDCKGTNGYCVKDDKIKVTVTLNHAALIDSTHTITTNIDKVTLSVVENAEASTKHVYEYEVEEELDEIVSSYDFSDTSYVGMSGRTIENKNVGIDSTYPTIVSITSNEPLVYGGYFAYDNSEVEFKVVASEGVIFDISKISKSGLINIKYSLDNSSYESELTQSEIKTELWIKATVSTSENTVSITVQTFALTDKAGNKNTALISKTINILRINSAIVTSACTGDNGYCVKDNTIKVKVTLNQAALIDSTHTITTNIDGVVLSAVANTSPSTEHEYKYTVEEGLDTTVSSYSFSDTSYVGMSGRTIGDKTVLIDSKNPTISFDEVTVTATSDCNNVGGVYYCTIGDKVELNLVFSENIYYYENVEIVTNMGTITKTNKVTLENSSTQITLELELSGTSDLSGLKLSGLLKNGFYDKAGNKGTNSDFTSAEITLNDKVNLDVTNPTITEITAKIDGSNRTVAYDGDTIIFTITASEPVKFSTLTSKLSKSGLSSYKYSLDGSSYSSSLSQTAYDKTLYIKGSVSPTANSASVYAYSGAITDRAGLTNVSYKTKSITIYRIDSITFETTCSGDNGYCVKDNTITATVNLNNTMQISSSSITTDSGVSLNYSSGSGTKVHKYTYTVANNLDVTLTTFKFSDNAYSGMSGRDIPAQNIKIDSTNPTLNQFVAENSSCNAVSGVAYCTSNDEVTVKFTFSENIHKYDTISIVTNMGTITQNSVSSLETPSKTVTFRLTVTGSSDLDNLSVTSATGNFYDQAGNKVAVSKSNVTNTNIKLDVTNPKLSISNDSTLYDEIESIFTITATEPVMFDTEKLDAEGLTIVGYSLDGSSYTNELKQNELKTKLYVKTKVNTTSDNISLTANEGAANDNAKLTSASVSKQKDVIRINSVDITNNCSNGYCVKGKVITATVTLNHAIVIDKSNKITTIDGIELQAKENNEASEKHVYEYTVANNLDVTLTTFEFSDNAYSGMSGRDIPAQNIKIDSVTPTLSKTNVTTISCNELEGVYYCIDGKKIKVTLTFSEEIKSYDSLVIESNFGNYNGEVSGEASSTELSFEIEIASEGKADLSITKISGNFYDLAGNKVAVNETYSDENIKVDNTQLSLDIELTSGLVDGFTYENKEVVFTVTSNEPVTFNVDSLATLTNVNEILNNVTTELSGRENKVVLIKGNVKEGLDSIVLTISSGFIQNEAGTVNVAEVSGEEIKVLRITNVEVTTNCSEEKGYCKTKDMITAKVTFNHAHAINNEDEITTDLSGVKLQSQGSGNNSTHTFSYEVVKGTSGTITSLEFGRGTYVNIPNKTITLENEIEILTDTVAPKLDGAVQVEALECNEVDGIKYCSTGDKLNLTLTFNEVIYKYDSVSIVSNFGDYSQASGEANSKVITFEIDINKNADNQQLSITEISGNFYDEEENVLSVSATKDVNTIVMDNTAPTLEMKSNELTTGREVIFELEASEPVMFDIAKLNAQGLTIVGYSLDGSSYTNELEQNELKTKLYVKTTISQDVDVVSLEMAANGVEDKAKLVNATKASFNVNVLRMESALVEASCSGENGYCIANDTITVTVTFNYEYAINSENTITTNMEEVVFTAQGSGKGLEHIFSYKVASELEGTLTSYAFEGETYTEIEYKVEIEEEQVKIDSKKVSQLEIESEEILGMNKAATVTVTLKDNVLLSEIENWKENVVVTNAEEGSVVIGDMTCNEDGCSFEVSLTTLKLDVTIQINEVVKDLAGNRNESTSKVIMVDNDLPRISSVEIEGNNYAKADDQIVIKFNFKKKLSGNLPTLKVTFNEEGKGNENITSSMDTEGKVITYVYTVTAGDSGRLSGLSLSGGSLVDENGNSADLNINVSYDKDIVVDTEKPTLEIEVTDGIVDGFVYENKEVEFTISANEAVTYDVDAIKEIAETILSEATLELSGNVLKLKGKVLANADNLALTLQAGLVKDLALNENDQVSNEVKVLRIENVSINANNCNEVDGVLYCAKDDVLEATVTLNHATLINRANTIETNVEDIELKAEENAEASVTHKYIYTVADAVNATITRFSFANEAYANITNREITYTSSIVLDTNKVSAPTITVEKEIYGMNQEVVFNVELKDTVINSVENWKENVVVTNAKEGTVVISDMTCNEGTCSFTVTVKTATEQLQLQVNEVVKDLAGNRNESASKEVAVDNVVPEIETVEVVASGCNLENGVNYCGLSTTIEVKVSFDDIVSGELPKLTVTFNEEGKGNITSSLDTEGKVITYVYTVTAGDSGRLSELSLSGGSLVDNHGNSVDLTINVEYAKNIQIDTVVPTITKVEVVNSDEDYELYANERDILSFTVYFSVEVSGEMPLLKVKVGNNERELNNGELASNGLSGVYTYEVVKEDEGKVEFVELSGGSLKDITSAGVELTYLEGLNKEIEVINSGYEYVIEARDIILNKDRLLSQPIVYTIKDAGNNYKYFSETIRSYIGLECSDDGVAYGACDNLSKGISMENGEYVIIARGTIEEEINYIRVKVGNYTAKDIAGNDIMLVSDGKAIVYDNVEREIEEIKVTTDNKVGEKYYLNNAKELKVEIKFNRELASDNVIKMKLGNKEIEMNTEDNLVYKLALGESAINEIIESLSDSQVVAQIFSNKKDGKIEGSNGLKIAKIEQALDLYLDDENPIISIETESGLEDGYVYEQKQVEFVISANESVTFDTSKLNIVGLTNIQLSFNEARTILYVKGKVEAAKDLISIVAQEGFAIDEVGNKNEEISREEKVLRITGVTISTGCTNNYCNVGNNITIIVLFNNPYVINSDNEIKTNVEGIILKAQGNGENTIHTYSYTVKENDEGLIKEFKYAYGTYENIANKNIQYEEKITIDTIAPKIVIKNENNQEISEKIIRNNGKLSVAYSDNSTDNGIESKLLIKYYKNNDGIEEEIISSKLIEIEGFGSYRFEAIDESGNKVVKELVILNENNEYEILDKGSLNDVESVEGETKNFDKVVLEKVQLEEGTYYIKGTENVNDNDMIYIMGMVPNKPGSLFKLNEEAISGAAYKNRVELDMNLVIDEEYELKDYLINYSEEIYVVVCIEEYVEQQTEQDPPAKEEKEGGNPIILVAIGGVAILGVGLIIFKAKKRVRAV